MNQNNLIIWNNFLSNFVLIKFCEIEVIQFLLTGWKYLSPLFVYLLLEQLTFVTL